MKHWLVFALWITLFAIRACMSLRDGDVFRVVIYGVAAALGGLWLILRIIAPGAWIVCRRRA